MQSTIETVNLGSLFFEQCRLCLLPSLLFQSEESQYGVCLNCILKTCGHRNDIPCMNCVAYGFCINNMGNYPGTGKGLCYECAHSDCDYISFNVFPTVQSYNLLLTLLRCRENYCPDDDSPDSDDDSSEYYDSSDSDDDSMGIKFSLTLTVETDF